MLPSDATLLHPGQKWMLMLLFWGGIKNKQIDIFAFLSHATTHFQNSNFRLFHIYFTVAKVV